ncbi:D-alanyl-D-alanine carboxypeptidase family protein [Actinotalea ferrariae]|uniref:D-alanyl-D-alanine carboxypeptidase family protein n=1 Tax=Actinotalea ferrariae TaxID=1386098 RepID=UPI001C8C6EBC|nr:D-alanyl-D-alanine carboxypeptidase family protein [Actinotalea ferrariae]MBX9244968.1 D-alanyl-D-alanine carboxypeptidase family protein [Actinotalea ferrariae]
MKPAARTASVSVVAVAVVLAVAAVLAPGLLPALGRTAPGDVPALPADAAPTDALSGTGAADPRERDDQIDPFDDAHPAIAGLDPDLRAALQAAARDAAAADVDLWVTSGRRSAEYQQELLDRAEQTYGSLEAALERVATPETSSHVTGGAVDIGPTDAADWVGRFGDAYGLCQTYANEMWHFELATTPGGECPAQLPDATP